MLEVMRGFGVVALATTLLAADPSAVSAQLPGELRDGRRALSMGLLADSGATVGFSIMLTSRTALTIDVMGSATLSSAEAEQGGVSAGETDAFLANVHFAPGVRRYMAGRGDVASFVALRALLGYETFVRETTDPDGTVDRTERRIPSVGGAAGFGLEWFATDAMSVRGEVVLDGTYRRSTEEFGNVEQRFTSMRVGLGRSALTVSILF